MRLGTRQYTLPHTLDPEQGPKTLKEFAEHATAVQDELGKDGEVHGTFFGSSRRWCWCSGCR
ncbi:hypothetical protein AB0J42_17380 [Nonomuraea sp. NPDC049649]|uniref:hypothetical protein n=1 Tax=Nonomuraea sp. NPDC049649 TaxID=3155776 RepID=UPI00342C6E7D